MKGSDLPTSRSAYRLRQAESDTPGADVCRQIGVSEASLYCGRSKYAKLGLTGSRAPSICARNTGWKRLLAALLMRLNSTAAFAAYKSDSCWRERDRGNAI
jgi:putative transposase